MFKKIGKLALLAGAVFCIAGFSYGEELTAKQILNKVDESLFPKTLIMKARMINYESGKKKNEFLYNIKAKSDVGTLMLFEYPRSEVGKKFLFKDRNIWMAIPGVSNPIRLSPKQNFMGSSFSNNDLMDTKFEDDYEPAIEGIVNIEGRECYKIVCRAKNPEVTYDKVIMIVTKDNFIPIENEYYTRSGKLLKTMSLSGIKELAGKQRPSKLTMKNKLAQNDYTTLEIESMEEADIPSTAFGLDALKK